MKTRLIPTSARPALRIAAGAALLAALTACGYKGPLYLPPPPPPDASLTTPPAHPAPSGVNTHDGFSESATPQAIVPASPKP